MYAESKCVGMGQKKFRKKFVGKCEFRFFRILPFIPFLFAIKNIIDNSAHSSFGGLILQLLSKALIINLKIISIGAMNNLRPERYFFYKKNRHNARSSLLETSQRCLLCLRNQYQLTLFSSSEWRSEFSLCSWQVHVGS